MQRSWLKDCKPHAKFFIEVMKFIAVYPESASSAEVYKEQRIIKPNPRLRGSKAGLATMAEVAGSKLKDPSTARLSMMAGSASASDAHKGSGEQLDPLAVAGLHRVRTPAIFKSQGKGKSDSEAVKWVGKFKNGAEIVD